MCAKNFIPQAHTMLGEMYRLGQGVDENTEEAIKHYETGAEQGTYMGRKMSLKSGSVARHRS